MPLSSAPDEEECIGTLEGVLRNQRPGVADDCRAARRPLLLGSSLKAAGMWHCLHEEPRPQVAIAWNAMLDRCVEQLYHPFGKVR